MVPMSPSHGDIFFKSTSTPPPRTVHIVVVNDSNRSLNYSVNNILAKSWGNYFPGTQAKVVTCTTMQELAAAIDTTSQIDAFVLQHLGEDNRDLYRLARQLSKTVGESKVVITGFGFPKDPDDHPTKLVVWARGMYARQTISALSESSSFTRLMARAIGEPVNPLRKQTFRVFEHPQWDSDMIEDTVFNRLIRLGKESKKRDRYDIWQEQQRSRLFPKPWEDWGITIARSSLPPKPDPKRYYQESILVIDVPITGGIESREALAFAQALKASGNPNRYKPVVLTYSDALSNWVHKALGNDSEHFIHVTDNAALREDRTQFRHHWEQHLRQAFPLAGKAVLVIRNQEGTKKWPSFINDWARPLEGLGADIEYFDAPGMLNLIGVPGYFDAVVHVPVLDTEKDYQAVINFIHRNAPAMPQWVIGKPERIQSYPGITFIGTQDLHQVLAN